MQRLMHRNHLPYVGLAAGTLLPLCAARPYRGRGFMHNSAPAVASPGPCVLCALARAYMLG